MQISKSYGVSKATVSNIVKAYADGGIKAVTAINRNPNSNARRKADGRTEAEIPVVCMDEKPYQMPDNRMEPLPMRPGDIQKTDSDIIQLK